MVRQSNGETPFRVIRITPLRRAVSGPGGGGNEDIGGGGGGGGGASSTSSASLVLDSSSLSSSGVAGVGGLASSSGYRSDAQLLAIAPALYEIFRNEYPEILDSPDLLAAAHQMGVRRDWPLAEPHGQPAACRHASSWLTQERARVLVRVGLAVQGHCKLNHTQPPVGLDRLSSAVDDWAAAAHFRGRIAGYTAAV